MTKQNTKALILNIINKNNGITAKGVSTQTPLTRAMVFRHLKDLCANDKIFKIGTTPKVKYYPRLVMNNNTINETKSFNWAMTGDEKFAEADWLCSTQDVFQARQEKILITLKYLVSENVLYLLTGAAGEIGNNSFDHNLGNWRDAAGVLFIVDIDAREIILADRGQGLLSSLRRVRPKTSTDEQAIRVAFTEIISGREPEQRGNGLKFVKKVIEENKLSLRFYSGQAMVEIINDKFAITARRQTVPGCLAIIKF